ncbi:MAG: TolC family protein [Acidobacteria bacterium]|nr:TolC family protein [Acidobacteriota bacterium]
MRRVLVPAASLVLAHSALAFAQSAPLTLPQAVAEALAASPVLRQPDDGRTLAVIRERQAAARFGIKLTPAFQAGSDPTGVEQRHVGLGVSKRFPTGADVRFDVNAYRYGRGGSELRDNGYVFSLSQPLLRGFGAAATAELTDARRGIVSADRAYSEARQQLVVSVAETYVAVTRAARLAEAAERSRERAVRLRVSSEARARVGLASELDVLRADLLASQAEAELVSHQEAVETARDSLKLLLGRPSHSDLQVADDRQPPLDAIAPAPLPGLSCEAVPESADGLVQMALGSRLDVREARDRVADARRAQSVARWNLLPPVTVDATYTQRGLGAASSALFAQLFNGWRVGASTSYALDRSDESAAAAAAGVSVRAAEQAAIDIERRAAEEVRRACRAWIRTASTIEIQSKAVTLAERQLRLAQIRYERGIAGNFDVVDAETNLFQAQSGLIDAQVQRALAGLVLHRATGTLDPARFEP